MRFLLLFVYKAELPLNENSKASVVAVNAEIRRKKARLLEEVLKLQRLTIKRQSFEYNSDTKKCTCPFCKQSCTSMSTNRLYFQSVGDQNESCLSKSDFIDDPELLHGEVTRLDGKVSSITSISEL